MQQPGTSNISQKLLQCIVQSQVTLSKSRFEKIGMPIRACVCSLIQQGFLPVFPGDFITKVKQINNQSFNFDVEFCRPVLTLQSDPPSASFESYGGRFCYSYCSWPPVQQKSRLLIGLNVILVCFNSSNQITK